MSHKSSADEDFPVWGEGPRPVVLVLDRAPERRQRVEEAVSTAGARAQRVDSLDPGCQTVPAAVAMVGLEAEAASGLDLRPIRMFAAMGFRTVAYGDGAHSWPLGTRCRAFLAGASALLDSAQQDFPRELRRILREAVQRMAEDRQERTALRTTFARLGMVGDSPRMLALFRTILRISVLSDFPVVITGETGTGKELVARALHRLDPKRSQGPFVPLNCNAVNPGLVESELFGHRRGAFTGATQDRRGLIRAAQRGVLFLDEIGDLDAALQGKLLRVLQEGQVLGVGEERETPIDVRVVAATNRSLPAMVGEGRFRADLWHRLSVLSVEISPLRERPDDMRPLVERLIQEDANAGNKVVGVDDEYITVLQRLSLPGNVREVENLVRKSLAIKDDARPLGLSDLPREAWAQIAASDRPSVEWLAHPGEEPQPRSCHHSAPDILCLTEASDWNLSRTLSACERVILQSALLRTSGSHAQAARLLGVTSRTIYNKVRKHTPARSSGPY